MKFLERELENVLIELIYDLLLVELEMDKLIIVEVLYIDQELIEDLFENWI